MAHNSYYLDLCVDTYVVCGERVLIRMHEKYHNWGSVGGHIDAGQDANEAAVREAWEEAGLNVRLVGPRGWEKTDTDSNLDLVPPLFVNRQKLLRPTVTQHLCLQLCQTPWKLIRRQGRTRSRNAAG